MSEHTPPATLVPGTDADSIYIEVNRKRMSLTAFLKMERSEVETVYASGCTALAALDLPVAEYVNVTGCTALAALDLPVAKTVYASGCTALAALDLPVAKTVDVTGCTALAALDLPVAEYVYVRGVPAIPNFFAGTDRRGYDFTGVKLRGIWFVCAGCRFFTFERALKHWGAGGVSNRPDCLALVQKIIAHAAAHDAVAA